MRAITLNDIILHCSYPCVVPVFLLNQNTGQLPDLVIADGSGAGDNRSSAAAAT